MSGSRREDSEGRLAGEFRLPPYSYVTGRYPHPTSDPLGHSFGHAPLSPPPIVPERYAESRAYLFGLDLFNHGYYWEAHETWEALWIAAGRSGTTADFLKGLIKLAAAGVKVREGRPDGVRRHAARARELFQDVRAQANATRYLGFDLAAPHRTGRADRTRSTPASRHRIAGGSRVRVSNCREPEDGERGRQATRESRTTCGCGAARTG